MVIKFYKGALWDNMRIDNIVYDELDVAIGNVVVGVEELNNIKKVLFYLIERLENKEVFFSDDAWEEYEQLKMINNMVQYTSARMNESSIELNQAFKKLTRKRNSE